MMTLHLADLDNWAGDCDLFVLDKRDFVRALEDHPQFAESILEMARKRYEVIVTREQILDIG